MEANKFFNISTAISMLLMSVSLTFLTFRHIDIEREYEIELRQKQQKLEILEWDMYVRESQIEDMTIEIEGLKEQLNGQEQ